MSDDDRINVMLSREVHKALVETKRYGEELQVWADFVVSEGLQQIEAARQEQREADE
jgi:hypothetical protein